MMRITNSGSYTIDKSHTNPDVSILRWHGVWAGAVRKFDIARINSDITQIIANDDTGKFRRKLYSQFFTEKYFIARNKMYTFLDWETFK